MPAVDREGNRLPWERQDLSDHVAGKRSMGHYMVDSAGMTKLFAFDLDLDKPNPAKEEIYYWRGVEEDGSWTDMEPREFNPREAWLHPQAPENLRRYLRVQLQNAARTLSDVLDKYLREVPIAVSYSGNKGLHVYGLTGEITAAEARTIGKEIIRLAEVWSPSRGDNFYKMVDPVNDELGMSPVSIELFPKQDSLDGKDLGNLMRLPLGVHAKSGQQAHFMHLSHYPWEPFQSVDPIKAMTEGNPWAM